jgi:glycosyltransferase involved in cell wall biosynthesis
MRIPYDNNDVTCPPTVSFIVPCYKLGHLLPECIASILSQTYEHFEILIMDDASPDNTSTIALSFSTHRVRYIRNESNLGHLRNYNKGISLARGQFIWLISADDRLRKPYVLERYVNVLNNNPRVGYVFCPAVGLRNGVETGLISNFQYGATDTIFQGAHFISTVLSRLGGLASPSVMARKECYDNISNFPLDMPHQGDLYLWFVWALEYDVAYLAEPMVNYRCHELNMNKDFVKRCPEIVFTDEINVLWRIRSKCSSKGLDELAMQIEYFIAVKYAQAATLSIYGESSAPWGVSIDKCEEALRSHTSGEEEYDRLRRTFYALMADRHWAHRAFRIARESAVLAGEHSIRDVVKRLYSSDWTYAEKWVLAELYLSAARLYWCQGQRARGFMAAGRAVVTWPRMLGRPVKPLLQWIRA